MKVTKEGSLPTEGYTGTCTKCGCEVECCRSELDKDYCCNCPTPNCGTKISCFPAKGQFRYGDEKPVRY